MIAKEFTQAKEHAMHKLQQAIESNQVDTTLVKKLFLFAFLSLEYVMLTKIRPCDLHKI